MRIVFGLVLVLGIGLAGFAAYMAKNRIGQYQSVLASQKAELDKTVPTKQVFIVNRRVAYGEAITKKDVQFVAWPVNAIPEGAFEVPEDLFPEDGQPAHRPARDGEGRGDPHRQGHRAGRGCGRLLSTCTGHARLRAACRRGLRTCRAFCAPATMSMSTGPAIREIGKSPS